VRVLIPLPDHDFDVTEVAVPWRVLRDAGHEVVFSTERGGTVPAADPRLLTGVIFGQLGAERGPRVLAARGTESDDGPAFAVTDGNYVSARWPGDAYLFARRFSALLG
jgi:putative intracellular protease/amidase